MTHTPLTKAEREELRTRWANAPDWCVEKRWLADLDAAEAERDEAQERVDLDIDEFRRILAEMDNLRVRIPVTPEGGRVLYDMVQGIVLRATNAGRQRVPLIAQRDRAESELADVKENLAAAEAAHSELFLSGQVAELRGKLAALVDAVDSAIDHVDHEQYPMCGIYADARTPCECGVQKIRAAIAASRGGAS